MVLLFLPSSYPLTSLYNSSDTLSSKHVVTGFITVSLHSMGNAVRVYPVACRTDDRILDA